MIEWIGSIIEFIMGLPPWGIALFFVVSGFLENVVQPWPGTTTLVFGGALRGMGYDTGWIAVLLMFFIGEALGMLLVYEFGARGGARALEWKWIKKFYNEELQQKTQRWLTKYGAGMLFIAKFAAGANTLADLFAGIMKISRRKAYPAMLAACAAHNALFFLLGGIVGDGWESAVGVMDEYNRIAAYAVIIMICAYLAYKAVMYGISLRTKARKAE